MQAFSWKNVRIGTQIQRDTVSHPLHLYARKIMSLNKAHRTH